MVQRTLINGTGYTIIGGRTLIDGTVTIKMGKPTDLEDAYEMLLGGDEA